MTRLTIWLWQLRAVMLKRQFDKLSVYHAGDLAEIRSDRAAGDYDPILANRAGRRGAYMEQIVRKIELCAIRVEQLRK